MSNELGDYGTNDLGTYFQTGGGPNQWLPNGSSYITSPTLGNLLTVDEIFVEIEDCILDLDANLVSNAIVGQSSVSQSGGGSREFEITLYTAGGITDGLLLYTGEIVPTTILSRTQMIAEYGGVVITGKLSVRVFPQLETFEVYRDDALINSGPFTVALGNKRIDGTLFRVGAEAEGNGNPPNTGGEHTAPVGWRIGNLSVSLDTGAGLTKVRELVMPTGTATNVPDIIGSNDGTLREGTGDGSDWGEILTAENTASSSTTETGQILGGLMPGNSVSSPSTNNLGVMSTALISGLDSQSASRSEFGSMVSQIIFGSSEISGSNYQIGTMTTNGLISGLNVRSGSTTEEGLLVTAIINASDSVSISSTQQGIMNTALISGLNSISASNTEIGILTTVKYNSNRIMVIGA